MEYNNICSSEINSGAGRPCLEVEKEDILLLKRLNYSWTRIAGRPRLEVEKEDILLLKS